MTRRHKAEPPLNARLVIDGAEYPCDVMRDADLDTLGCFAWVAVPRQKVAPCEFEKIHVCADTVPVANVLVAIIPAEWP